MRLGNKFPSALVRVGEMKRILPLSVIVIAGLLSSAALSQSLDQQIIERSEGDLDTCLLGEVAGLKANGDGFLAVRSGPGSKFNKLDEVYNGDFVWVFASAGKWLGIVYGVDNVDCSPISQDRVLNKPGRKGWVHRNWVREIAG